MYEERGELYVWAIDEKRNYKLFSPPTSSSSAQNTATTMEAEICERKMKYIYDISSKFFGSQVIWLIDKLWY